MKLYILYIQHYIILYIYITLYYYIYIFYCIYIIYTYNVWNLNVDINRLYKNIFFIPSDDKIKSR